MAEMSYLWTTGGDGDGSAEYTRADWQKIIEIIGACHSWEGVAADYLDTFDSDLPGAEVFRVKSGGAIVDGRPYINSASVDLDIPAAVGVGNTRIDRVVLRANWTAQTVRLTVISGIDAGSPAAPAITQTSGTTYDLPLYQVLVDTAGDVSVQEDERQWAQVLLNGLADGILTADSAGRVKMADSFVSAAKIAADSVDKTKAGDGIIQVVSRLGGSATDWNTGGSTNYTPAAVKLIAMAITVIVSGGVVGVAQSFGITFGAVPICLGYVLEGASLSTARLFFTLTSVSTTAIGGYVRADDGSSAHDGTYVLHVSFMGKE